jgi:hypothetical protein
MTVAIAHAAPTAPAPIIPIFMMYPRLYPRLIPIQPLKVSASTLVQLSAADILNDRYRVTGREGMPEGFVESLICKFPIRILHPRFR